MGQEIVKVNRFSYFNLFHLLFNRKVYLSLIKPNINGSVFGWGINWIGRWDKANDLTVKMPMFARIQTINPVIEKV